MHDMLSSNVLRPGYAICKRQEGKRSGRRESTKAPNNTISRTLGLQNHSRAIHLISCKQVTLNLSVAFTSLSKNWYEGPDVYKHWLQDMKAAEAALRPLHHLHCVRYKKLKSMEE
eukprot:1142858-Pelagomonas_calceolata.AAC.1